MYGEINPNFSLFLLYTYIAIKVSWQINYSENVKFVGLLLDLWTVLKEPNSFVSAGNTHSHIRQSNFYICSFKEQDIHLIFLLTAFPERLRNKEYGESLVYIIRKQKEHLLSYYNSSNFE